MDFLLDFYKDCAHGFAFGFVALGDLLIFSVLLQSFLFGFGDSLQLERFGMIISVFITVVITGSENGQCGQ
ncbi:MAG: hypothetical protein DYH15_12195 [Nitrosomonas sp. PRO4]|nr:hypothetical protein [Nitrosomonas sp. PRO4]